MALEALYDRYELVVGLEVHVQLNTQTKLFSRESTAFGQKANTQVSAVSLALPGTLPYLNQEAVNKAIKMGLALNCVIQNHNYFERKNYFYGDLPKGYQTTQDTRPIAKNGRLDVRTEADQIVPIRINRIHMEEDAGKSVHDLLDAHTAIDLNRAGVPLIEIVTEPDFHQAEHAAAFIQEIRQIVRAIDVSDGNMEEGSLRCDANISVRKKGETTYGTRCEVKNINSMRNLKRAIEHEFKRQVDSLEKGEKILQCTLNFDADTGETSVMRIKEDAHDYRYFACPDLPPLYLTEDFIQSIKSQMPALPAEIAKEIAQEAHIPYAEAMLIGADRAIYKLYLAAKTKVNQLKSLCNWLNGPLRNYINENIGDFSQWTIDGEQLADMINLVDQRQISLQNVFSILLPKLQAQQPVSALVEELNLRIEDNDAELLNYIREVFEEYSAQVQAYKKGKKGVLGLFVGEVMKKTKGKADAQKINKLIIEKLNE